MSFRFPVRKIALECPYLAPVLVENTRENDPGFTRSPYWLLCPRIFDAVQNLESRGWISILEDWIQGPARSLWEQDIPLIQNHLRNTLDTAYSSALEAENRLFIGGVANPFGVKCLHAHYAFFMLFGTGLVGRMVDGLLTLRKHNSQSLYGGWCPPQKLECDHGRQS